MSVAFIKPSLIRGTVAVVALLLFATSALADVPWLNKVTTCAEFSERMALEFDAHDATDLDPTRSKVFSEVLKAACSPRFAICGFSICASKAPPASSSAPSALKPVVPHPLIAPNGDTEPAAFPSDTAPCTEIAAEFKRRYVGLGRFTELPKSRQEEISGVLDILCSPRFSRCTFTTCKKRGGAVVATASSGASSISSIGMIERSLTLPDFASSSAQSAQPSVEDMGNVAAPPAPSSAAIVPEEQPPVLLEPTAASASASSASIEESSSVPSIIERFTELNPPRPANPRSKPSAPPSSHAVVATLPPVPLSSSSSSKSSAVPSSASSSSVRPEILAAEAKARAQVELQRMYNEFRQAQLAAIAEAVAAEKDDDRTWQRFMMPEEQRQAEERDQRKRASSTSSIPIRQAEWPYNVGMPPPSSKGTPSKATPSKGVGSMPAGSNRGASPHGSMPNSGMNLPPGMERLPNGTGFPPVPRTF